MPWLAFTAALFIATHLVPASAGPRDVLVARAGEATFRVIYSTVAIASLILLVLAWQRAPWIGLWEAGAGLRHLAVTLMPLAFVLVVASLTATNPSAVGPTRTGEAPISGIIRVTRHPFMWGVALWSVLHVLANGDLASLLFFGTFAIVALVGARLQDLKLLRRDAARWRPFQERTSFVPFGAVAAGRQPLGTALREIGLWRFGLGVVLYAVLLVLHPWLFGVAALG